MSASSAWPPQSIASASMEGCTNNPSNPSFASTARNGAGIDTRPFESSRLVKLETKRSWSAIHAHATLSRPDFAREESVRPPLGGPGRILAAQYSTG